jgi:hypothetical protein
MHIQQFSFPIVDTTLLNLYHNKDSGGPFPVLQIGGPHPPVDIVDNSNK